MSILKRNALFLAGLGLIALAGQAWSQEDLTSGKALFKDRCVDCHRTNGEALPPPSQPLRPAP